MKDGKTVTWRVPGWVDTFVLCVSYWFLCGLIRKFYGKGAKRAVKIKRYKVFSIKGNLTQYTNVILNNFKVQKEFCKVQWGIGVGSWDEMDSYKLINPITWISLRPHQIHNDPYDDSSWCCTFLGFLTLWILDI